MIERLAALKRRLLGDELPWQAPEVLQTSSMDCGPAALASWLTGCGLPTNYARLREACQTDVDGTSIDAMEELANGLGLATEQVMLPAEALFAQAQPSMPCIAVVLQAESSDALCRRVARAVRLGPDHGPVARVASGCAKRSCWNGCSNTDCRCRRRTGSTTPAATSFTR